jgi:hypothetical protein
MIRNLKVLGLAMMAILALSAVVASAASAQNGRITSTGNFTLTGTEIAGKVNALAFEGVTVECPGSTYDGHKFNVTPHTFIPSGAEVVTITPTYKQPCKNNFSTSTVDMNGCDYVMHIGPTIAPLGTDTYSVTYDIVCPAGKDITVTNWLVAGEHAGGVEPCTLHIAPQNGLIGGDIRDTTEGDLVLEGEVAVNVVQTKNIPHPLLCPAKSGVGKLKLNVTVKAHNEALVNTAISLSHL